MHYFRPLECVYLYNLYVALTGLTRQRLLIYFIPITHISNGTHASMRESVGGILVEMGERMEWICLHWGGTGGHRAVPGGGCEDCDFVSSSWLLLFLIPPLPPGWVGCAWIRCQFGRSDLLAGSLVVCVEGAGWLAVKCTMKLKCIF